MSTFEELRDAAEEISLVVERLYRTRRTRVELFGRPLRNQLPGELVRTLHFAQSVSEYCTSEAALDALTLVDTMELTPCLIDVGDLIVHHRGDEQSMRGMLGGGSSEEAARDVIVKGFGRIGRLLVRQMVLDGCQPFLELRGIQVRPGTDLERRAALLRHDSVHGPFHAEVRADPGRSLLIINDRVIPVYEEIQDEDVQYEDIQNALMIDCTGAQRDRDALEDLVRGRIGQVLLTAPGKKMPNLIYGVSDLASVSDSILAAASCTTNAAVPVLDLLDEEVGIEYAWLETVHAYTNDQNLVDNAHGSARRSRSAALNMVPTSSGASQAISDILPQLENRLQVNAIRVPVANVSLLIFHLHLARPTSTDEMQQLLLNASIRPTYRQLIGYSEDPEAVSSDFIGDRRTCVVDGPSVSVQEERCSFYVWYDNEAGYCTQVLRLAQALAAEVAPLLTAGPLGELPTD